MVFALLTVLLTHTGLFLAVDRRGSAAAQNWLSAHPDPVLLRLLPFGEAATLVLVVGLVAGMTSLAQGRWRPLLGSAVTLVALAGMVEIVKALIGRAGPSPSGRWPAQFGTGGGAFPSGHTAGATVGLLLVASLVAGPGGVRPHSRAYRVLAALAVAGGVAVGVATMLSGWHWPTDVLGGLLIAGVAAPLGLVLVHRRPTGRSRPPTNRPPRSRRVR